MTACTRTPSETAWAHSMAQAYLRNRERVHVPTELLAAVEILSDAALQAPPNDVAGRAWYGAIVSAFIGVFAAKGLWELGGWFVGWVAS